MSVLNPPLVPQNGHTLEGMIICRVSDPRSGKQDERSNDDQEAQHRRWLEPRTDWPVNLKVIAGSGSGEILDREEAKLAEEELFTGKYDFVLTEYLGRIFRRLQAFLFCEAAEDVGTRVIAPNDLVDTAREDWRMAAFFAAMRHEMHNTDTSKRIRRTHRNRFTQGGVFQYVVYGYIKPPGAKGEDDVKKDPAAEPIYDRWFTMLEEGATFSEVADWLNTCGIPTGPFCHRDSWDGKMVARVTRNAILKGLRVRNDKMAKRINRTGRRITVKAPPEERLERSCPHLAFIEPKRYDRVVRLVNERNAKYRRRGENGRDTRAGVSKKRTRWPGQHLYCGICGRLYVYGGHGQREHLMCSGAREHKCWNWVTVDGPLAATKIIDAVHQEIEVLPGFSDRLVAKLREEVERLCSSRRERLQQIDRELGRVERHVANIVQFIREGHHSRSVANDLKLLEAERARLEDERESILQRPDDVPELPPIKEVKSHAREAMQCHTADPPAFGRLMRRWIPKIVVFPIRLIDGGHVLLRARFRLQLASLAGEAGRLSQVADTLTRVVSVDLFDARQRELHRRQVCELRASGMTEKQAAAEIGITHTAAQRAAALQRLMDRLGLDEPYVELDAPPEDYAKLRRHHHPRYIFDPLDDAGEF